MLVSVVGVVFEGECGELVVLVLVWLTRELALDGCCWFVDVVIKGGTMRRHLRLAGRGMFMVDLMIISSHFFSQIRCNSERVALINGVSVMIV